MLHLSKGRQHGAWVAVFRDPSPRDALEDTTPLGRVYGASHQSTVHARNTKNPRGGSPNASPYLNASAINDKRKCLTHHCVLRTHKRERATELNGLRARSPRADSAPVCSSDVACRKMDSSAANACAAWRARETRKAACALLTHGAVSRSIGLTLRAPGGGDGRPGNMPASEVRLSPCRVAHGEPAQ
jgi:hypothetical protein